jgi:hypothetical protein
MTLRSRRERLRKQLTATRPAAGPVTVFLVAAGPGLPVGRREVWAGPGSRSATTRPRGRPSCRRWPAQADRRGAGRNG